MCVGGHRLDCLAGTTFDRSGKVSSGHLACPSIVKRFSSGQLLASTGGSVLASAEDHRGRDVHGSLPEVLPSQCKDVDQACYALVQDLKQRGMLDDTIVVWGGEFGRTIYSQGKLTATNYGRDHHPRCFSMWMAGGGFKGGVVHGETDDFSYNIIRDPVHIRDFQATFLHLLGIDHERFSYKYQGLDQRLTGVEKSSVVKALLA